MSGPPVRALGAAVRVLVAGRTSRINREVHTRHLRGCGLRGKSAKKGRPVDKSLMAAGGYSGTDLEDDWLSSSLICL